MIILSHRGYWTVPDEKNSPIAFKRSFDLGFGTETDVRDCVGRLVISHDMPVGNELDLGDFLRIYGKRKLPLAINIKSDGLVAPLKQAMQAAGISDWFVFDMSIPDMRSYLKAEVPVFARMSEVEKEPAWIDEVSGIWLDGFSDIWYDTNFIDRLLNKGLRVCIVSPELHGREHEAFWSKLSVLSGRYGLMLCTDFPEQARDFFEVGK
jgi:hypothetical protein